MKENKILNSKYYDSVYNGEIPSSQYYVDLFNIIPSHQSIKKEFKNDVFEQLLSMGFELMIKNAEIKQQISEDFLLIHNEKKILVVIRRNTKDEINDYSKIEFLYNIKNGELNEQIDYDSILEFRVNKIKSNILLVKSDSGYLDTEEFTLNIPEMDIVMNYGSDFIKTHDLIVKRFNQKDDKGIVLLHGVPGSGKTTYIKFLTKYIPNKEILFIPPSLAEVLGEPSIIPFLMEHRNSILIIEDGDRVISDRKSLTASSIGVSNILNITDGILGDCLNIQVLVTFNMERENIDPALLRKGRLICEHKFKHLSVDESNDLLFSIGIKFRTTKPLTLADIYNADEEELESSFDRKKIGFNI